MFSTILEEALTEMTVSETGGKINVCKTPLDKARAHAEKAMKAAGKDLDKELPDFDANYKKLQKACSSALGLSRKQMPVIEPEDMARFTKDLNKGHIDLFKPFYKGKLKMPGWKLPKADGPEWLTLGVKDGDLDDDKIPAKWTNVSVGKLKPTQSQIWLEKLIDKGAAKFGAAQAGGKITKQTIIVSRDGYILDGHHRFGQAIISDPSIKMKAIIVPLTIKQLLKLSQTYGAALGHKPKA